MESYYHEMQIGFYLALVDYLVDSMTKFDIKNYLERIYNIPVARVNTHIIYVAFQRDHRNRRFKPKDDFKLAHVTLVRRVVVLISGVGFQFKSFGSQTLPDF